MNATKLVHMLFFLGGLVLGWFVLVPTVDWIWVVTANDPRPPDLIVHGIGLATAGVATFMLWRNRRIYGVANEVAVELTKVTWPTRQETKWATIVVIITVIVAAVFLGVFDLVWSWITGKLYG